MDEDPLVVAVTGASGYIGTGLLWALEQEEKVERILALDTQPLAFPIHNVTAQRLDTVELPDDIFADNQVTTVVHLAFHLKPGYRSKEADEVSRANLKGTEAVLEACRAAKVENLIFVSSHTVYGAHRNNPVPITEGVNPRPIPGFRYGLDKAACEKGVLAYAHENPQVAVTILRCCVVLGPSANNYITTAMFKPLQLKVLGYDPPLQFVHESDLSRLLAHLAMNPQPGVFNVAGDGVVPYSRLARLAARRILPLPAFLVYPLVQMAWILGIQTDSPAVGLNYIRYPVVMSTNKLVDQTSFEFAYTSEEALQSYLYGRAR